MYRFNVRVYGLLVNDNKELLLSDEREQGFCFSKFPGGGLEYGEGLLDALRREFLEECDSEIKILSHFYTTDFFERSHFNESQVISIYYLVKNITPLRLHFAEKPFAFLDADQSVSAQVFRWRSLQELSVNDVTFNTDKRVVSLLLETIKNQ